MLQSYLVYISFALILFALGWHVKLREKESVAAGKGELSFLSWEIVASILVITFVMGARFKTGSDYMMYWAEYFKVGHGYGFSRVNGFEWGFELITELFASLKLHYSIYFAFWAFVQAALLYYGLRNHKFLLPWFAALLVLGPYSINWFSFMRQWVLTCAFVPMVYLIERRRFFVFALFSLILYTIHYSALLLLIFYFIPFKKLSDLPQKYHIALFVITLLLGLRPFWIVILKPIANMLPLLGYERYSVMFNDMLNGNYKIVAWGALHIITVFAQLMVVVYYKNVKEYKPQDKLLPIFFGLALIAICYYNVFTNTVHFLLRPIELTYVFILIMLAYVCDYLYAKKRIWELAMVVLPVISYVLINVVKAYLNPTGLMSEVINYHFFFIR